MIRKRKVTLDPEKLTRVIHSTEKKDGVSPFSRVGTSSLAGARKLVKIPVTSSPQ